MRCTDTHDRTPPIVNWLANYPHDYARQAYLGVFNYIRSLPNHHLEFFSYFFSSKSSFRIVQLYSSFTSKSSLRIVQLCFLFQITISNCLNILSLRNHYSELCNYSFSSKSPLHPSVLFKPFLFTTFILTVTAIIGYVFCIV